MNTETDIVKFPSSHCSSCGAPTKTFVALVDFDDGLPAGKKFLCDKCQPLDEDGLRLLLDQRDAEITQLRAGNKAACLSIFSMQGRMIEAESQNAVLRAERDGAVLAERERCKKSVRNTICNMSWPPEDGDQLIDDLQTGIALFATEEKTNG